MRILVTGAAGFIGSNFVNWTMRNKPFVSIVALDALTYAGSLERLSSVKNDIQFVHGDIRNSELVDELISGVDLLINFAAESHNDNSLDNPRPFIETNVLGTFELIQACVKHKVRYHHISTDEVFGDLPLGNDSKFTEHSPYNPSSPYSASKASSDMLVKAWVRSFGLRATISNCSNNYGPSQHKEKLIPRTILLATNGIKPKVYGDGSHIRDWIHVEDHIKGVWAVIDRGSVGQTYLLGSDGQRSNLEVVQTILRQLEMPDDFIEFVSDRPGHDVRYAIDGSRAREELGWSPQFISFEEGLFETIDHYKKLATSDNFSL